MASRHSTFWSFLLMALVSSTAGVSLRRNEDLVAAMEEMQRANYFTYVMLINMATAAAAADLFRGNLTFLMPNDRTLAKTAMLPQENAVTYFLLRHSIPSALLFDDMLHFPTNSMIPTSNYPNSSMLRVSNDGRRRFLLNNVRVISPNICTAGSSIRCHGIDGVVDLVDHHSCSSSSTNNDTIITPPPTNGPASVVATAPAPLPEPAPAATPTVDRGGINQLSDPSTPQKSSAGGSHDLQSSGRLSMEFAAMTLMMMLFSFHEMRLLW